jgi:multidrug efflux pump
MRRTLGTAVFSGMLGVTLFGIFLTPVFYYVIQWFTDWRAARLAAAEVEATAGAVSANGKAHDGAAVSHGPEKVRIE